MSSAESTQTKICKPVGKPFRVHTPTLLQMEAVECGAAALGILLHHYGVWASLEKLRVECGVSRDGSKAGNIIRVARMYGCEADGYKVDTAELFEDKADFPCIVFWDFNHFVVVEGWAKNKVFLNDPACGPRTVSWEEFDKSFTGVALVIKPGENFQKHGRPPSLLGGLLSRIGSGKLSLLLVFLASLGLVIPGLAAPVFNRLFIDDVLVGGLVSWITPLLLGIGASAFIRMMLSWLQGYYLLRLQTGLALRECSRFMWHVLRLPAQFFMQRYAGEIGTRVALNNEVVSFVSGELAQAAVGVLTAVFYLVVMVQYNMFLTSMAVLMALVNVLFLQLVWRTRSDANMRLLQDQGKLSSFSMGGLQMMPTIKACGLEDDFFARWAGYYSGVMTTQSRLAQLLGLMGSIPAILTAVNSAVVLVAGGLSVMSGAMSLGGLMAFQILSGAFLGAVGQFTALGNSIVNMRANVNRIEDVLAYDPDPLVDQAVDKPLERITGRISVDNVTFGYSRFIPPVVSNFSLELYPGKRVALVGGSGSGKSTIAKIISGLIEPWTGQVLFDGKPREYYDRASFISCLSVVDQSIFLFSGTVRDNLTLWDQTIRETDVIRGCEDACMHYDVVRRPGGYDANVEEGGGNFSGGQRQRLEIARALCRNPSVVILDEATSALDPVTESVIDNSLRRRGCSCIIVAHRLSTIRDADEIIVLDKGVVVQRGTHEELLADDNGHYAKLIADS